MPEERTGKFPWRARHPCAAGRLDVHSDRWQDAPPRSTGVGDSTSKQAPDLPVGGDSRTVASLWRSLWRPRADWPNALGTDLGPR